MEIENCIALVTGANRGLGKAYADALLSAGAAKVYAGTRDLSSIVDPRLKPIRLDVTRTEEVRAAAEACADVNLLINNASTMLSSPMLAEGSESAFREEIEVNVFGVLRMVQAFAPVLAKNGGGTIANVLSVVSWFVYPFNATYCASKHAALALTDAVRMQLKAQGTQVVGVYAGFVDPDMPFTDGPQTSPMQVAGRTLDGIRRGQDHVIADSAARDIRNVAMTDPEGLQSQMQWLWDKNRVRYV